jgi:SPP1 family predicted phage head-tail adaptor
MGTNMGLDAGTLDRRATILKKSAVQANSGQEVETWTPVATLWAGKRDARASERYSDGQMVAEIDTVFTFRYFASLLVKPDRHRIVCEGLTYDVFGATEIGRHEGVKVSAGARAEAAA